MSNTLADVTIKSGGTDVTNKFQFVAIEINKAVNRIPTAQLKIVDGEINKEKFAASDSGSFDPGKTLEISLAYQNKPNTKVVVFKGIIVRHRIKACACCSHLIIDAKDEAFKLTTQRNTAIYKGKDSDIIKSVIGKGKVSVNGSIPSTSATHKQMVQYNATDWDFVLARADVNGLWVVANDNEISILDPKNISSKNTYKYIYGMDTIYSVDVEIDGRQQLSSVKAKAWDVVKQEQMKPVSAANYQVKEGSLSPSTVAKKLSEGSYTLQSMTDIQTAEIQAWADAKMLKTRLAFLKGTITVPGDGAVKIGDAIKLEKFSKLADGQNIITGIQHQVSPEDGWKMTLQLGVSAEWYHEQNTISDAPAGGLLPAINGLQVGIVKALTKDDEDKFRIQVTVEAFGSSNNDIWARLASPYATNEAGFFFIPEKGDEVIIGFFNDDPRQAVILGSMYNPKRKPPLLISNDNNQKGIIIKKDQTQLLFDTKEKTFKLATSKTTSFDIKDEDNITTAVKDEKLALAVSSGITIQSKKTLDMSGQKIKQTSKSNADIKVSSALNVNCDGNITIKGSQVDIS